MGLLDPNLARRRIEDLLDQVQSTPRKRSLETAIAANRFLSASGGLPTEDLIFDVAEIAVDAQLARCGNGIIEDVLEELAGAAQYVGQAPDGDVAGIVNCAMISALFVERLTRESAVEPDIQVAAFECVNMIDDVLVRARGRYPLRLALLRLVRDGVDRVPDRVRHADLVARLKWAIHLASSRDGMLVLDAVESLRALVPTIEQRIGETFDGEGPGTCPDGRAVAPGRTAGVWLRAGPLRLRRQYRSLPRLRAQALYELGRTLTFECSSSSEAALEEAAGAFERASTAWFAVGDVERSAHSAVAAVQCLDWKTDLLDDADSHDSHLLRVAKDGLAAHRQVVSSHLPEGAQIALAMLARAAYQRADWVLRLRAARDAAEFEATVKDIYADIWTNLAVLKERPSEHPWPALACASGAVEHLAGFLDSVEAQRPPPADDSERRDREARRLDLCRHYVTPEVVEAFAQALRAVLESQPESASDSPARPAPDVWTPQPSPAALWRRVYQATAALLLAAQMQEAGLPAAHWPLVARAFEYVRPLALPVDLLLRLRDREADALALSVAGDMRHQEIVAYVEQRVGALETQLANPVLSVAERLLLSGWIARLVQSARLATDDLPGIEPLRAVLLVERAGAAAFRAQSLLYGRDTSLPQRAYGLAEETALPPDRGAADSTANIWYHVDFSRGLLDFWSRAKMIREAARSDGGVRRAFRDLLEDPPGELLAMPPDTPAPVLAEMCAATGTTEEECERRSDRVLLRFRPDGLSQIDRHLDATRRWLAALLQQLATKREIDALDFKCPAPESRSITEHLTRNPGTAVILPGPWPEEMFALNVITSDGDRIRRELLAPPGELDARALAMVRLFALLDALADDRREASGSSARALDEAFSELSDAWAPWSRALACLLETRGVRHVVFVLRGPNFPHLPWDMFPADEGTALFDERFTTSSINSLAELPERADRERSGTAQIHGSGFSSDQIEAGRVAMQTLSSAGLACSPIGGAAACDGEALHAFLRQAARVRFFAHSHHDRLWPDADRLTLVDDEDQRRRVNLRQRDLRRLPLAGVECVELWACEGGAHGRQIQEHGVSDEPEDLTTALLLAGARRVLASRWHVPALPSALLLERFALHVHGGQSDSAALAASRRDYREAFAVGGPIERSLREGLDDAMRALAAEPGGLRRDRRETAEVTALADAINGQRRAWFASAGLPGPSENISPQHASGFLVKWVRPRAERIADALQGDPTAWPAVIAEELLRPLRSPGAWAGWRVTLRDLRSLP